MIRLFTDTSANLPLAVLNAHGIEVLPFSYTVNGVQAPYDAQTPFDGEAFYSAMRNGADVRTSLISVGHFVEVFEPVLAAGDEVLYVGMSGGISGTANSAAIAVSDLEEKFPNRHIAAIDTFAASLGEGLLVLQAAEMIADGFAFEEIVREINTRRHTMCQYFTVDDLMYLKKGGRIPGAVAIIGNLLGIKPLLMGDETGHIVMRSKTRGFTNALKAMADKYDALSADKRALIGIAHADNEHGAEQLLSMLRERGLSGECMTVLYEPVTGAHVGPGTVALFYPGTEK